MGCAKERNIPEHLTAAADSCQHPVDEPGANAGSAATCELVQESSAWKDGTGPVVVVAAAAVAAAVAETVVAEIV